MVLIMPNRRLARVSGLARPGGGYPYLYECLPNAPIRPGLVLLGTAREIYAVLEERGMDPDEIIAEAGLDPRLFRNGNSILPFKALCRLFADAMRRTECGHLALLVGQRASLDTLGPVGALMRHSPTIGAALTGLEAHLWIQNRGAVAQLDVSDELAAFSYSPYDPGTSGAALNSEEALATTVSVLRELAGHQWSPQEVRLPRAAPPDLAPYWHFFRAPVRFDQDVAAIVAPASFLSQRIAGADPHALQAARRRIQSIEEHHDRSLVDRLRRLLRTELMKSRCSAGSVAERFAVNRRTLNRRLKAEGTTFREVADQVRFEIARQLISETSLELSHVAAVLNFSEPCAFTRAFRRWSGHSPSTWRRLHGEAADHGGPLRMARHARNPVLDRP